MRPDPALPGGRRIAPSARDAVIRWLSLACGDGRLTVEDYSARVHEAHVVRSQAELDRLVSDLPAATEASSPDRGTEQRGEKGTERDTEWHVSPVGGIRRHGHWQMDRHLVSLTVLGGASLDLRGAELTAPEVTLTKLSVFGTVTVCVPAGIRVIVEGRTVLGSRTVDVDEPAGPEAPLLRIRVFSVFGGVRVRTPRHAPPHRCSA